MKLYQIINETLVREFPDWIESNGTIYTNEEAKSLAIESGLWYPLIVNDVPEFDSSYQYIIKNYYLEDDHIVLDWIIHNVDNTLDANME